MNARPVSGRVPPRGRTLILLAVFVALAVLHTWPLVTAPARLSRLDNADTALNTWIVAWVEHAAFGGPGRLFNAPIFHPAPDALAFSEHMLVPSLMGLPLARAGVSPVAVYNLLAIAGFALSGWSMAFVIARWTRSTAAGLIAGALFAFNAHLLTRLPHLQALHVEFLPLTLLAFDAVLDGPSIWWDGKWRVRWGGWWMVGALAAAFALQALCSNYTLVFLTAALAVALAVRPDAWWTPEDWSLARAAAARLALAGVMAALAMLPFLLPYYRVHEEQGLTRSLDEVALYSATWRDYLATAGRLHYEWWSHRGFDGHTALFPGVTAMLLAAIAIATGVAWRDRRARMVLAFGIAGVVLSFGPAVPGYAWLYDYVPLVSGIRGAARWGFLGLTAVAILAGFGVARLEEWLHSATASMRASTWAKNVMWQVIIVALLALVTIEALRAPMTYVDAPAIPRLYARLAGDPRAVIVEFPLYITPAERNARYLLNATQHFQPMVNGYSGFMPLTAQQDAAILRTFPSDEAVALMRLLGVTYVTVHADAFEAERGEAALTAVPARPELTLVQEEGDVRLYRLR